MRSFADTKKGADVQKNREVGFQAEFSRANLAATLPASLALKSIFAQEKGLPAPAKKGTKPSLWVYGRVRHARQGMGKHGDGRHGQSSAREPVAEEKVVEQMVTKMKTMRTSENRYILENLSLQCACTLIACLLQFYSF